MHNFIKLLYLKLLTHDFLLVVYDENPTKENCFSLPSETYKYVTPEKVRGLSYWQELYVSNFLFIIFFSNSSKVVWNESKPSTSSAKDDNEPFPFSSKKNLNMYVY